MYHVDSVSPHPKKLRFVYTADRRIPVSSIIYGLLVFYNVESSPNCMASNGVGWYETKLTETHEGRLLSRPAWAEIRIDGLPNTKHECYPLNGNYSSLLFCEHEA
jgi:hypothetical protein